MAYGAGEKPSHHKNYGTRRIRRYIRTEVGGADEALNRFQGWCLWFRWCWIGSLTWLLLSLVLKEQDIALLGCNSCLTMVLVIYIMPSQFSTDWWGTHITNNVHVSIKGSINTVVTYMKYPVVSMCCLIFVMVWVYGIQLQGYTIFLCIIGGLVFFQLQKKYFNTVGLLELHACR